MNAIPPTMNLSKLDGLRGIAATIVIFSHTLFWFLPAVHLGERTKGRPLDGIELFNSPFSFFYRGGFSVSMFFILSGLVLTYSISRKSDVLSAIRKSTLKRYIRLGFPVAISVLIGCLLMFAGVYEAPDISPLPVLSAPYSFTPNWLAAIKDALYGALLFGDSRYNYVLWTIQIELIGSIAVFAGYALCGTNKNIFRIFCVVTFLALSASTNKLAMYTSLFFLGALLTTVEFSQQSTRARKVLSISGLIFGLYLAGFHSASDSYTAITAFTNFISQNFNYAPSWLAIAPALGGFLIVISILSSDSTYSILDSRPMKWLGKLSFSVYLLHTFVLVIAGQFFTKHFGMTLTALALTLSSTLLITFTLSYFYYKKVDLLSIALAEKFANACITQKSVAQLPRSTRKVQTEK